MRKIWVSRVTPEGLQYMETVTVRSRRKRRTDLDKAVHTATTAAMCIMTAVLVYVTVPMAWAIWQGIV